MDEVKHYEMKEENCPACKIKLDSISATPGERPPRPHDISICWNCQEVLILQLEESGLLSPRACTVDDISKWSMALLIDILYMQMHMKKAKAETQDGSETQKSILDMTNEEIIALVKRNKILREEATQEKMVVRQKETAVKDAKVQAKEIKNEAMDMLKAYMAEQEKKK